MKRALGFAAVAAGLLMASASSAALVVVQVDVNLANAILSTDGTTLSFTGATIAPSVAIKDGDQLQLAFYFSGSQAVSVTNPDSFLVKLTEAAGQATSTKATGSLNLMGTTYTSSTTSLTSSNSATASIAETKFTGLTVATFTGLAWDGLIDYTSFADNLGTTKLFDTPSFQISADAISISGTASVPEAATWAMMVIGFGAIGGAMRARRTSVKFA